MVVAQAIDPTGSLIIIVLSATLAGSVFGDHCSPISDTTILSSAGAGCVHIEHVSTQLPFALIAAFSATCGYLVAGFTENVFLSLGTGFIIMIVIMSFLHLRNANHESYAVHEARHRVKDVATPAPTATPAATASAAPAAPVKDKQRI